MTANWFSANPSSWPDLQTAARQLLQRLFPAGLIFDSDSDEYRDVQAKGDIYTWLQEALWWVRTSFWPQYDTEALFLELHESALSVARAATTTLRQNALIAHYRTLRRTLSEDLTEAIFCRVFGSDDPSDVAVTVPATEDIWRCFAWQYADQAPATKPSARYGHSMVYDSANDLIVLFGGYDGAYDDETWTYDVSTVTWTNKAPATKPSARRYHAMAYRDTDDCVYLFGGYDGALDDETWKYDVSTNTWTNLAPATKPGARQAHGMVWDSSRDVLILFGGDDGAVDDETWEYSFSANTWTQINPATKPGARQTMAMIYNRADGLVYLFGGYDVAVDNETWTYDGTTWTQLTPTDSPSAREGVAAVYDQRRQSMIVIGGYDGSNYLSDAWEYYDGNWHQHHDIPLPRDSIGEKELAAIAYDTDENMIIIFGGFSGSADDETWHLSMVEDNNTWARYQTYLHIYSGNEDTDEDYPLAQTLLQRGTPSGWTWTCGRYLECEYGSTADSTEFGTYNTACYGTRD